MNQAVRLRVNNEIPAYRPGLVAALDVGTSKIVCVIGQAESGSLKVLGSSLRESSGLKAGTITSLEQAEESIRDCVAAAENMADARIQNVLISVNCGQPVSVTSRTVMSLDGALVSDNHLRALLADGRARAKLEGHEIIQSAPTAYVVDEARGVKNPSGMFCQRIGVAMHAVAVKPSPLQNLKLAVERCHLNVIGTQFGAYASGLSTLTEDEKQIGATVIDMGGGTTSIAVFLEGHLVHADVVPMGGFAVTSDIARMLAAPLAAAERTKTYTARRWATWTAAPMSSPSPRWARRARTPPCACRAPCSPVSSRPGWRRFSARSRPACERPASTWRRAAGLS
ncbi:MAG TPA: cell division protein FtsA [Rhizomicrobium sp.]|nr:cell division protein FtsA [Rhizomicrobium sp.]